MLQNYYNDYTLLQEKKSLLLINDDGLSTTSTLFSEEDVLITRLYKQNNNTDLSSPAPTKYNELFSKFTDRSKSFYKYFKVNLQTILQSRRESKREKRPQDGRTNPME